jgi:AraC-like DNA-binding protein
MADHPHEPVAVHPDVRTIIYFLNGQVVFFCRALSTKVHRHHAVQLTIALDRPFVMGRGDDPPREFSAALVDSDVPHRFGTNGAWHAIFLMDPEREAAGGLRKSASPDGALGDPDTRLLKPLVDELRSFSGSLHPYACAERLLEGVVARLCGSTTDGPPPDERVKRAVALLKRLPEKRLSVKRLARAANLSEGRMSHLFTEEVGIPIRSYLLWLRIIEAVKRVFAGDSLTTAAHASGFADSAHFCRTFGRMFGMRPSDILKNSRFVQVVVPPL